MIKARRVGKQRPRRDKDALTQGAVNVVSPPSWFGETVFTTRSMLCEGEPYVVRGMPRTAAASRAARLV